MEKDGQIGTRPVSLAEKEPAVEMLLHRYPVAAQKQVCAGLVQGSQARLAERNLSKNVRFLFLPSPFA